MSGALPIREGLELDLAAEVLRRFGELRFIARGSSMIPSVYPGDLVTVRRERDAGARRGEIFLSVRESRFWIHRVTRKFPRGDRLVFATQGDALLHEDPVVDQDQLLGRVISIVRRGKRMRLPAKQSSWIRLLCWGVRRSPVIASLLLRWHSLRNRIMGKIEALENPGEKFLECM